MAGPGWYGPCGTHGNDFLQGDAQIRPQFAKHARSAQNAPAGHVREGYSDRSSVRLAVMFGGFGMVPAYHMMPTESREGR